MDDTTKHADFDQVGGSPDQTSGPSSTYQDVSLLDLVAARTLGKSQRRETTPNLCAPCPSEAKSDDPSGESDEKAQQVTIRLGGNGF